MKRCFIRGVGCEFGFPPSLLPSVLLWICVWLSFGTAPAAVLAQWDFNATTDTNHPATSAGEAVLSSAMKSPMRVSASGPIGASMLSGCRGVASTARTFLSGSSNSIATSSGVGSRPRSS